VTRMVRRPMIARWSFLRLCLGSVDAAADSAGANRFLAELGAHLIGRRPAAPGAALTLAIRTRCIARRTWLWRADNGEVIEALGFAPGGHRAALGAKPSQRCRPALARNNRWPAPYTRTLWGQGTMGLSSPGSARVPSSNFERDQ